MSASNSPDAAAKRPLGWYWSAWAGCVPLILAGVGLALRLRLATGRVTMAVPDDAFYDFAVARSLAAGLPPAIDGVHATNGYHPLWVAMLAAIYRLMGDASLKAPIVAARVVGGICDALGLVVTNRLLKNLDVRLALRAAAIAWLALNPFSIEQGTNGLETSLALLLLATTSLYYSNALARGAGPRFVLISGALCGLTVLGRTELLVPCGAWVISVARKQESARAAWLFTAKSLGVAAVVLIPWLSYSWFTTGSVVQSSATAMMFIFWKTPLAGGLSDIPFTVAFERSLHSFRDGIDLTAEYLGTGLVVGCALSGAAVMASVTGSAEVQARLRPRLQLLFPLWVSLGLLFVLFTTVRLYFETWHTAPFVWATVLFCTVVADGYQLGPPSDAVAVCGVVIILALARGNAPFRELWNLTGESTRRGARTDCGVDAYVARGKITNIDGVVNNAALAALRRGELLRYVKELGPDYLYLDDYFHSSVFFGARYREQLVAFDDSAPELLKLATPEQKDDRLRIGDEEVRPNTARGREVLSDGWLWDMAARAPDVRSLGRWSELVVVMPEGADDRHLQVELSAFTVAGGKHVQRVTLFVDGAAPRKLALPRERAWYDVEVPLDGHRHRIRLEYADPRLEVDRAPGVRWWWRSLGYQVNAVIFWGMRLTHRS